MFKWESHNLLKVIKLFKNFIKMTSINFNFKTSSKVLLFQSNKVEWIKWNHL